MGEHTKRAWASSQLRLILFLGAGVAVLVGGILLARRSADSRPDSVVAASPTEVPSQDAANTVPRPATATVTDVGEEASEIEPVEAKVAGWDLIPLAPLEPRQWPIAAAVGGNLVVIGGLGGAPCPPGADCSIGGPAFDDGAVLDSASGVWNKITPAPISLVFTTHAVVGNDLYVLAREFDETFSGEDQFMFLRYSLIEDRWDALDLPPDPNVALMAAGELVVAFSPSQERGATGDAVFNPENGHWEALPLDPLVPSFDRSMVWTGDRIVLTGIEVTSSPGGASGPAFYRAASLDLASSAWQDIGQSEVIGYSPAWYWTGDALVNPALGGSDGGATNNYGEVLPYGGVLDPGTGLWTELVEPPDERRASVGPDAADDSLVVTSQGWAYRFRDGAWAPVPELADHGGEGAVTVVVEGTVYTWGGARFADDNPNGGLLNLGWAWTPTFDVVGDDRADAPVEFEVPTCDGGASCEEGFVVDGAFHGLSCRAIQPDAVTTDVLAVGVLSRQQVEVRSVEGIDPGVLVAVSLPGGECSEGDPGQVLSPWSAAFPETVNNEALLAAICSVGMHSPAEFLADRCHVGDELVTCGSGPGFPVTALDDLTVYPERTEYNGADVEALLGSDDPEALVGWRVIVEDQTVAGEYVQLLLRHNTDSGHVEYLVDGGDEVFDAPRRCEPTELE